MRTKGRTLTLDATAITDPLCPIVTEEYVTQEQIRYNQERSEVRKYLPAQGFVSV